MSAPARLVRVGVYSRDGHRCITCSTEKGLQFQHRRAEGMGGRQSDTPGFVDGVTTCAICNPGYESHLQAVALRWGWKVRSWVTDRSRVPVFYPAERSWYRLTAEGGRVRLVWVEAMEMMWDVYGPAYDETKGLIR